jgi:drug/metabolite transporter (DMT)-like permease
MFPSIPPQLIALGAALSYAISGIAARRGMRYSTPITVTLVSMAVHAVTLWGAVLLTGGIPSVSWWVLFLFAFTGILQPIIRLFTYAGIFYVGASRGTTLRSAHPLFSTGLAILFLGEQISFPVVVGTFLIVAGITLISWQSEAQKASFRWWHIAYPLGAAFLAGVSHPLRRLCFESGQRASLSCRYHRDRRTALVGKLSVAAKQESAGGLGSEMYMAVSRRRII